MAVVSKLAPKSNFEKSCFVHVSSKMLRTKTQLLPMKDARALAFFMQCSFFCTLLKISCTFLLVARQCSGLGCKFSQTLKPCSCRCEVTLLNFRHHDVINSSGTERNWPNCDLVLSYDYLNDVILSLNEPAKRRITQNYLVPVTSGFLVLELVTGLGEG